MRCASVTAEIFSLHGQRELRRLSCHLTGPGKTVVSPGGNPGPNEERLPSGPITDRSEGLTPAHLGEPGGKGREVGS